MKVLYILTAAAILFTSQNTKAQSPVNPDLSFEAQRILDEGIILDIRYYYYPNLQAYFDTQTATYLYNKEGEWFEGKQIPAGIRGYSVNNGIRVAITDYAGDEPFDEFEKHKVNYPPNYTTKRQPAVKNAPDTNGIAYN